MSSIGWGGSVEEGQGKKTELPAPTSVNGVTFPQTPFSSPAIWVVCLFSFEGVQFYFPSFFFLDWIEEQSYQVKEG